jgi:hypothetical protein
MLKMPSKPPDTNGGRKISPWTIWVRGCPPAFAQVHSHHLGPVSRRLVRVAAVAASGIEQEAPRKLVGPEEGFPEKRAALPVGMVCGIIPPEPGELPPLESEAGCRGRHLPVLPRRRFLGPGRQNTQRGVPGEKVGRVLHVEARGQQTRHVPDHRVPFGTAHAPQEALANFPIAREHLAGEPPAAERTCQKCQGALFHPETAARAPAIQRSCARSQRSSTRSCQTSRPGIWRCFMPKSINRATAASRKSPISTALD